MIVYPAFFSALFDMIAPVIKDLALTMNPIDGGVALSRAGLPAANPHQNLPRLMNKVVGQNDPRGRGRAPDQAKQRENHDKSRSGNHANPCVR